MTAGDTRPPADTPAPDTGPVFIIGAPRSGSTVLAYALGRHPRLWTAGELHLLWAMFGEGRLDDPLRREEGFPGMSRAAGITGDDWASAIGHGIEAMLLERSGGRRWVDQTPVNTHLADVLRRLFPTGRFLHILRDGRLVVRSMLAFRHANPPDVVERLRAGGFWPAWADDFDTACRIWATSVDAAMEFAHGHADRVRTIRQEDLLADPFLVFDQLYPFLGLAPDEGPGWFASGSVVNSSFARGTDQDPRAVAAGWSALERRRFDRIAGPTMTRWAVARS